jgi:signal transduction histidine kinase
MVERIPLTFTSGTLRLIQGKLRGFENDLQSITLKDALEEMAGALNNEWKAHINVRVRGQEPTLSVSAKQFFFKVALGVIDSYRHAKTIKINLNLKYDGQHVILTISDNGVVFGVNKGLVSYSGLNGIPKELVFMGASLTIIPTQRKGINVTIRT